MPVVSAGVLVPNGLAPKGEVSDDGFDGVPVVPVVGF